ncbi:copper resistance protein CopC [Microbacterium koreense]|uniref:Copper resistance protein CopC n=1 Tax=Microbacterium koreense TaxID=323761 RepID=A0ABW2ZS47_9MICO
MLRARKILAGVAVTVVAVLAPVAPASAHDELVSSDPAADQALVAAPETVTLQFTGDVLTMGAVIMVADADGTDWTEGDPLVDGATVSAIIRPGMPEAGYEVRWRVVSGDGHPVAGIVPFTVGDGDPLTRDAESVESADATTSAERQTDSEGGALRAVLIGVGGALIAIALYVAVRTLTRRRTVGVTHRSGVDRDTPERHNP